MVSSTMLTTTSRRTTEMGAETSQRPSAGSDNPQGALRSDPHVLVVETAAAEEWTQLALRIRAAEHSVDMLGKPALRSQLWQDDQSYPAELPSEWVISYLKASAEHLTQWADLVVPRQYGAGGDVVEHHYRPHLSLGRCGLEAAAQAVWVLGPADADERALRHLRLVYWDLYEEMLALKDAGDEFNAKHAEACSEDLIRSMRARFSARKIKDRPSYSGCIEFAAEQQGIDPLVWGHMWRGASGAAHGRRWVSTHSYDVSSGPGALLMRTPRPSEITSIIRSACEVLERGLALYCNLGGLDFGAQSLQGLIHAVSMTPAAPENEADKAAFLAIAESAYEWLRSEGSSEPPR